MADEANEGKVYRGVAISKQVLIAKKKGKKFDVSNSLIKAYLSPILDLIFIILKRMLMFV